jgi:3-methyl-2-oxobutanoate hydroxymethyltransferase
MMHHSRAVQRACHASFLIGDMPFGSYESSPQDCLKNAIRYMKEGKVEMVKLEGGKEVKDHIRLLKQWGIPCMAHIGLTPQRHVQLGGFKVQGKTLELGQDLIVPDKYSFKRMPWDSTTARYHSKCFLN